MEGSDERRSGRNQGARVDYRSTKSTFREAKVALGTRIRVYWEGDRTFFAGRVREYNEANETYLVVYDDGDQRQESLHDVGTLWRLESEGVEDDAWVEHKLPPLYELVGCEPTAPMPQPAPQQRKRKPSGGGGGGGGGEVPPPKRSNAGAASSGDRRRAGLDAAGDAAADLLQPSPDTAPRPGRHRAPSARLVEATRHAPTQPARPPRAAAAPRREAADAPPRRPRLWWGLLASVGGSGAAVVAAAAATAARRKRAARRPSHDAAHASDAAARPARRRGRRHRPWTEPSRSQAAEARTHARPRPLNASPALWRNGRAPSAPRRVARVGAAYQAVPPPLEVPSVCHPPALPPLCLCGRPAAWQHGRWWCAARDEDGGGGGGGGGCAYETQVPPTALTPLCGCGHRAAWLRQRWWCPRFAGGCGLECAAAEAAEEAREEPRRLAPVELEREAARSTAALLRAVAHGGELSPRAFVAPSDCGLGVFARCALRPGQVVAEYTGPRLPLDLLVRGEYALVVTGAQTFVDGNWDNADAAASPFAPGASGRPRGLATYANHSRQPNARFEARRVGRSGATDLRERMLLVAAEPVEAGAELRVDYESGGSDYWAALGTTTTESAWRDVRRAPPPPADPDEAAQADAPLLPVAPPVPSGPGGAAVPWEGARGGDAQLRLLARTLLDGGDGAADAPGAAKQERWALVASHLPGRSGLECRERWRHLQSTGQAGLPAAAARAPRPAALGPAIKAARPAAGSPPRAAPPAAHQPLAPAKSAAARAAADAAGRASGRPPPLPGGMARLRVVVPPHARPRDTIVTSVGGRKFRLTVPEAARPGQRLEFHVRVGPRTAAAAPAPECSASAAAAAPRAASARVDVASSSGAGGASMWPPPVPTQRASVETQAPPAQQAQPVLASQAAMASPAARAAQAAMQAAQVAQAAGSSSHPPGWWAAGWEAVRADQAAQTQAAARAQAACFPLGAPTHSTLPVGATASAAARAAASGAGSPMPRALVVPRAAVLGGMQYASGRQWLPSGRVVVATTRPLVAATATATMVAGLAQAGGSATATTVATVAGSATAETEAVHQLL